MIEMFGDLFDLDHDGDIEPFEEGVGLLSLDDLLEDEKKKGDDFEEDYENEFEDYLEYEDNDDED